MKTHVAVAISGGVDSLMAAALLKEQGYRVSGIHFTNGFEEGPWGTLETRCAQMGIPVVCLDLAKRFRKRVVDPFIAAYTAGRTPNPCMLCNPRIKFGALMEKAHQLGASRLATGHYARITRAPGGRYCLKKGIDHEKDQSYFLARLTGHQLAHAFFPLGDYTKNKICQMAKARSLQPVSNRESQDVCFVGKSSISEFLLQVGRISVTPGPIQDTTGKQIGTHNGLHQFTIGQRRGINCPAAQPYYVCRIDTAGNILTVGFKEDLYAVELTITDINWIHPAPVSSIPVGTRLRYRHIESPSMLYPLDDGSVRVVFDLPQKAITPGQGAVFYQGDEVLGAGWIESVGS